jgi:hypothetical protein
MTMRRAPEPIIRWLQTRLDKLGATSCSTRRQKVEIATTDQGIKVGLTTGIAEDKYAYEPLIYECRCIVRLRVAMATPIKMGATVPGRHQSSSASVSN